MKGVKLYNVFFPIWLLIFIPPFILGSLVINFVYDSLVLLICFLVFKRSIGRNVFNLYKQSILKVWLIGFLADFVGAAILHISSMFTGKFELTSSVSSAIMLNPFESFLGMLIVMLSVGISSYLIYRWNYNKVLNRIIEDSIIRAKVAIVIAIVTAPWTFFLPTELIIKNRI